MMAGVQIRSPLMSRNIVEIFDIIESIGAELEEQCRALGELSRLLAQDSLSDRDRAIALTADLRASTDFCARMLG